MNRLGEFKTREEFLKFKDDNLFKSWDCKCKLSAHYFYIEAAKMGYQPLDADFLMYIFNNNLHYRYGSWSGDKFIYFMGSR